MMQTKMKLKRVALALAATGVLSGQALAAEGWDAELPGVQPVQVALAGTEAALPEQVALYTQEPVAQVVVHADELPAVLPELPAALAVAEPAPFSAADMQALFVPSTEPLRLAVLSAQEMEETQGAVIPLVLGAGVWAAGGAVVGSALHLKHHRTTRGMWRAAGAVGTGFFYASPLMRGVFGARQIGQFARATVGAAGSAQWFRNHRR